MYYIILYMNANNYNNNNDIYGLYIITSPLLLSCKTSKFGMSMRLQSRVLDYCAFINSPVYYSCYQFTNDHNKTEIYYIEQLFLKQYKNLRNDNFSSEYLTITPGKLDLLVRQFLNKQGVKYILHKPVKFTIYKNCYRDKSKSRSHVNMNRYLQLPIYKNIVFDDHQLKCVNSINTILTLENKCHVNSFCGTGKSIIAFYKLLHYNFSVIVVPTLPLVDQFYKKYCTKPKYANYVESRSILCVCSLNHNYCSTDMSYIENIIKKHTQTIIIVTYMSLHILYASCVNSNKMPN